MLIMLVTVVMTANDETAKVSYHRDVEPILRKHCTICHNQASVGDVDTSGGLALDSLASVQSAKLGAAQAMKNKLYTRLLESNPEKRMPKDDEPLSADKIKTIKDWFDQGRLAGMPASASAENESAIATARKRPSTSPLLPVDTTLPVQAILRAGTLGNRAGRISVQAPLVPSGAVTALAVNADGNRLAIGGFERVTLFDLQKLAVLWTRDNVPGMLLNLDFAPDGKSLWLVGGYPGETGFVQIIDAEKGRPLSTWAKANDVINDLAINRKLGQVVTVGHDRNMRVFDLNKGSLLHEQRAHNGPSATVEYSADETQFATGGRDAIIKVWDAKTYKLIRSITASEKEIVSASFTPDGKRLVVATADPALRTYSLASGERPQLIGGQSGVVTQLVWNRPRTQYLTISTDRITRLWNQPNRPVRSFQATTETPYAAGFLAKDRLAAVGSWDGLITFYDVTSAQVAGWLRFSPVPTSGSAATSVGDGGTGEPSDWLMVSPAGFLAASPTLQKKLLVKLNDQPLANADVAKLIAPDKLRASFNPK